jgi:carbon storage regulator
MLMISRRVGERIVIGNDIEITIAEIHRRTVRLAVKSVSRQVLRGEVRDAVEAANRAAAATALDGESLVALALEEPPPPPTGEQQ